MPSLSLDSSRARREQTTIKLRKKKREESRAKRRTQSSSLAVAPPAVPGAAPAVPTLDQAKKHEQQMALIQMAQDPQTVRSLLAQMSSQSMELRLSAVSLSRKLLSIEQDPPIQDFIDAGIVQILVRFLRETSSPKLQFESAWALTNIASGNTTQTRSVVEAGAIPPLISLIMSEHSDVQEQSIWALGNIAGDGPEFRNLVLDGGILTPLLSVMTPHKRVSLLRNGTWALSNMCRGKPPASFQMLRHCIPMLAQMLTVDDKDVLTDACWALSYLSDGSNEKVNAVVAAGVTRRLVDLMAYDALSVQTPALRTIGNIVTGDDGQTQAVVSAGAVPKLATLLQSTRRSIRKEAAWALSNITAGSPDQVGAVVMHGVLGTIIHRMSADDFEIRKECVWCICNATHGGTRQHIMAIAASGAIPGLVKLLNVPDARVVTVSLESLENILRVGADYCAEQGQDENPYVEAIEAAGGADEFEALQHHSDTNIVMKAKDLLLTYYDAVSEDEEDAPTTDGGEYTFPSGPSAPLSFGGLGGGLGVAQPQMGGLQAQGSGPQVSGGLMGQQGGGLQGGGLQGGGLLGGGLQGGGLMMGQQGGGLLGQQGGLLGQQGGLQPGPQ